MRAITGAAIVAACLVAGCTPEPEGVEPTSSINVEPEHVKVDHILVAAQNAKMARITRDRETARQLADELLEKLRAGADWAELKEQHSDDGEPGQPRGGPYGMANHGVPTKAGEMLRRQMVAGFGDVAFALKVGELGLAAMDPATSPYGFHIIKRLE